jgi:hypothetical protein
MEGRGAEGGAAHDVEGEEKAATGGEEKAKGEKRRS